MVRYSAGVDDMSITSPQIKWRFEMKGNLMKSGFDQDGKIWLAVRPGLTESLSLNVRQLEVGS